MFRTKSKIILVAILFLIILTILSMIDFYAEPVHRVNIHHTDPMGDVENPDIDIIQIGSYEEENNIVLALTVDGIIQSNEESLEKDNESFRYELTIITRNNNDQVIIIYHIIFVNGKVQNYNFSSRIYGDTLRIFIEKDTFPMDVFIVGLESITHSPVSVGAETDTTSLDRDRSIIFR